MVVAPRVEGGAATARSSSASGARASHVASASTRNARMYARELVRQAAAVTASGPSPRSHDDSRASPGSPPAASPTSPAGGRAAGAATVEPDAEQVAHQRRRIGAEPIAVRLAGVAEEQPGRGAHDGGVVVETGAK